MFIFRYMTFFGQIRIKTIWSFPDPHYWLFQKCGSISDLDPQINSLKRIQGPEL